MNEYEPPLMPDPDLATGIPPWGFAAFGLGGAALALAAAWWAFGGRR